MINIGILKTSIIIVKLNIKYFFEIKHVKLGRQENDYDESQ